MTETDNNLSSLWENKSVTEKIISTLNINKKQFLILLIHY